MVGGWDELKLRRGEGEDGVEQACEEGREEGRKEVKERYGDGVEWRMEDVERGES